MMLILPYLTFAVAFREIQYGFQDSRRFGIKMPVQYIHCASLVQLCYWGQSWRSGNQLLLSLVNRSSTVIYAVDGGVSGANHGDQETV